MKKDIDKCKEYRRITGDTIKEIRQYRGISVEALATMIGANPLTIERIENGAFAVNIDILYLLCDALNCRIEINAL